MIVGVSLESRSTVVPTTYTDTVLRSRANKKKIKKIKKNPGDFAGTSLSWCHPVRGFILIRRGWKWFNIAPLRAIYSGREKNEYDFVCSVSLKEWTGFRTQPPDLPQDTTTPPHGTGRSNVVWGWPGQDTYSTVFQESRPLLSATSPDKNYLDSGDSSQVQC